MKVYNNIHIIIHMYPPILLVSACKSVVEKKEATFVRKKVSVLMGVP
jgi:hypothetical protein